MVHELIVVKSWRNTGSGISRKNKRKRRRKGGWGVERKRESGRKMNGKGERKREEKGYIKEERVEE